jgi:hypothetical protein
LTAAAKLCKKLFRGAGKACGRLGNKRVGLPHQTETILRIMKAKTFVAVALAMAGLVYTATAQFSTDFNGANDPGWTHYAPGGLGQTFNFPVNPSGVGNYAYELTSNPGSGVNPGRVGSFRMADPAIPDFTITTDLINWNNSMSMNMGVMARVQSPLPGTTFPLGYALVYTDRFSAGGGGTDQLRLYKVVSNGLGFMNTTTGSETNGGLGQFGVVAGGSAPPDPSKDYQLVFTGQGNVFTGQIIDKSTGLALTFNDGFGGLTDKIVASDPGVAAGFGALYTTGTYGYFGFLGSGAGIQGNGTDVTFDNFAIIPEPSTLSLVGLGFAGFVAWNLRRFKRSL